MTLTLPTGITSTPIREYGDGCTVTTSFGVIYTFAQPDTAQRFIERIGARRPIWQRLSTPASKVHQRAYRLGPLPTCMIRANVRANVTVERTPPPDRNRPSPALRLVDSAAA